jgi:hypothetical protein
LATNVTKSREELTKNLLEGITALRQSVTMVGPENVPLPVLFSVANIVSVVAEMSALTNDKPFEYEQINEYLAILAAGAMSEIALNDASFAHQ